jgi:hypothetical protein
MKKTLRILRENKRLYLTLNLLCYVSIVVRLVYDYLRPGVGEEMAKWGAAVLLETSPTFA